MKSIDLETLRRRLDDERESTLEITLVDTLPESSFEKGHIPGAEHGVLPDPALEPRHIPLQLPDAQRDEGNCGNCDDDFFPPS